MPFLRPNLSQLQQLVAQDIVAQLGGSDALLQFSNMGILGNVVAALANLHYGYLDWIAQQAVPFTATGEYLAAWGALKQTYQKGATQASGAVSFPGQNGVTLPAGSAITRVSDGAQFTTTAAATVANGFVVVSAQANADPTGQTGAFGNTPYGVTMTLASSVAGIQSAGTVSTAFTGGADLETVDAFRGRVIAAYQNTPEGGNAADYVEWATAVPGVTRAWCLRNGFGPGTVVVYTMFDNAEAAYGGFPQGTNGISPLDNRATVSNTAAGDQLTVANAIYPLAPVTAEVYSCAPVNSPTAVTISGIPAAQQPAVQAAIGEVFTLNASPLGVTINYGEFWAAVNGSAGGASFNIVAPSGPVTTVVGYLATLGNLTFTT
jgi:uncharacterized phage protein gp47/JayE